MATIEVKGEKIRQAVKWISAILKEDANKDIAILIQDASNRFNLSPKDENFLKSFYADTEKNQDL